MKNNLKSIFSREQVMTILKNGIKKNQNKSSSPYGQMLRESKKISLFYGNLPKKYLQKVFYKGSSEPSKISENIFSILESRLDIVLYRSNFFDSIASGKQMIRSGGIKVNNKKVTSPSFIVTPGDIVSVFGKKHRKNILPPVAFGDVKHVLARSDRERASALHVRAQPSAMSFAESSNIVALGDNGDINHNKKLSYTRLSKNVLGWRFEGSTFLLSAISQCYKNCVLLSPYANTNLKNFSTLLGNKEGDSLKLESNVFIRKAIFLIDTITNTLNFKENKANKKHKNVSLLDSIIRFNKTTISHNIEKDSFYYLTKASLKNYKNSFSNSLINASWQSHNRSNLWDISSHKNDKLVFETQQNIGAKHGHGHADEYKHRNEIVPNRIDFKKENSASEKSYVSKNKALIKNLFLSHNSLLNSTMVSKGFDIAENGIEQKGLFDTHIVFLSYLLNLKKQYLALQKKKTNYKRQRNNLFFKNQNLFDLKKTKALHLEVSYRSLSIVFLFPPQRILFPFFINPSLIYK